MQATDLHGEGLRLQSCAMADRAGAVCHVALDFLARPGGVGFLPAAFEIGDHALEGLGGLVGAQTIIILEGDLLRTGAVENGLLGVFRNVAPAVTRLKTVDLAKRIERLRIIGRGGLGPRGNRTFAQGNMFFRHNQRRIHRLLEAETITGRAGTERIVEREQPRLDFGNGEAGDGTGELFRKQHALMRFVLGLVGAFPGRF